MKAAALAPWIASVAGPLLLLAATLGHLARTDAAAPPSGPANVLDQRLAGKTPKVVILGNSKVHSDIDRDVLIGAMGLTREDVADLSVLGATAPTFYAILQRRVYDAGHHPELVLVYGATEHFLDVTLESAGDRARVEDQLGGVDDPVLSAKVFGRTPGFAWLDRARRRRTEIHTTLLEGLRDAAVGALLAPPGPEPLTTRGAALAGPALERLFGADATPAQSERVQVGPIADPTAGGAQRQGVDGLDGTVLPDLVALAQGNDARIVFVRAPVRADGSSAADRALLADFVERLNATGAGWVDLSGLAMGASDFKDRLHMGPAGKARLSTALAEAIGAMDPLGDAPLPPALPPLTTSGGIRTGTGPALVIQPRRMARHPCAWHAPLPGLDGLSDSALTTWGPGPLSPVQLFQDGVLLPPHADPEQIVGPCAGASTHAPGGLRWTPTDTVDAPHTWTAALDPAAPSRAGAVETWWVYPGTTLRWSVETPWDTRRGAFVAATQGRVVVEGAAPAHLRVVDLATGTRDVALDGERFVAGTIGGDGPTGPWVLEVASPADGPYLLVERVLVGVGPARAQLVGARSPGISVLAGRSSRTGTPALDPPGPAEVRDGLRFLPQPALDGLTDEVLTAAGAARCSPLELRADGTPLSHRPDSKLRVDGLWRHVAGGFLLGAPGPKAPAGATFTVGVEATGRCGDRLWVPPGTEVLWPFDRAGWRRLGGPPVGLAVRAAVFGGDDPLRIELLDGEKAIADWSVPAADLRGGRVVLPLAADTLPARPLGVRAGAGGDTWFLLQELVIRDGRPPLPGDEGDTP